jgi:hypothetical protein
VPGNILYKHFILRISPIYRNTSRSACQLLILPLPLFHHHCCCYCLLFIPPSVVIIFSVFSSVICYRSNHCFFECVYKFTIRVQLVFPTLSPHLQKYLICVFLTRFAIQTAPFSSYIRQALTAGDQFAGANFEVTSRTDVKCFQSFAKTALLQCGWRYLGISMEVYIDPVAWTGWEGNQTDRHPSTHRLPPCLCKIPPTSNIYLPWRIATLAETLGRLHPSTRLNWNLIKYTICCNVRTFVLLPFVLSTSQTIYSEQFSSFSLFPSTNPVSQISAT